MISRRKFWIVVILVMIVQIIPFVVAFTRNSDGLVFGGFVFNPLDGNSYLAKMQQGWLGEWRFRLPYTAQPGEGAFLFLFYIALGHFSRLVGLPVLVVFHGARLAASLALFFATAHFFGRVFGGKHELAELAFVLAMTGGGMGWVVLFSGYMPADVWVAEGYPYLSMINNPHFPLGLALMLWLIQPIKGTILEKFSWLRLGLGFMLAVIQPFGVVVVAVVMGIETVWRWIEVRVFAVGDLFWSMGFGGPFLVYQFLVIQGDPILAGWNAQNLTPAPPVWDLFLSLSPALIIAIMGSIALWKERQIEGRRVLIGWLISGLVLIYLPFSLQRRFMTGLYIPVAGLAVIGIAKLRSLPARKMKWLVPAVFTFSIMTNLLMTVIGLLGVTGQNVEQLFITTAENKAMEWVRLETPRDSVIAASPELGVFIPAHTGRFVIYGHPFETIRAKQEQELLERFFSGKMDLRESSLYLEQRGVSYLIYGPREKVLGRPAELAFIKEVYRFNGVSIYSFSP